MNGYLVLALAALSGVHAATPRFANTTFPEGILGTWMSSEAPQSVLGVLAYNFLNTHNGGFSAQRDAATGDIWFTVLTVSVPASPPLSPPGLPNPPKTKSTWTGNFQWSQQSNLWPLACRGKCSASARTRCSTASGAMCWPNRARSAST